MRTLSIRRKLLDGSAPTATGMQAPVFQITSTKLDRHRDRILGVKAEAPEFKRPLLWAHASWEPALGKARCYQEGGVWVMEPQCDGIGQRSQEVEAKIKADTLDACSIGFIPVEGHDPVPNTEGGFDYPLVHLVEVSIVNVGANEDAVRLRSMPGQAGATDPLMVVALNAVATTQATLAAAVMKMAAAKDASEEAPNEEPAPAEGEGAEGEPTDDEESEAMTPKDFVAALVAHAEAGQALAAAFLETEPEDEELVAMAEGLRDGLPTDIEAAKGWLARAAETEEPEAAEPEDKQDEPLPEEEAKAMRQLVRKAYGFSVAYVRDLSPRQLREFAAFAKPAA
ncbi:HK97 family phage prohead protease [Corallococcus sp. AS-1-6]|uniref:HK97 family phage prohead protease n=1 Tax=Corallococcus sp. AS-1-6 TaxID=2874599 RepID=UPI001CBEA13D|nr:HK97 family phage prohead protease [Corallococcus sp. AS-1-6]MBZ4371476.1 HK97 family phage prohead protease [Corallococcus sp. AS-1-6]